MRTWRIVITMASVLALAIVADQAGAATRSDARTGGSIETTAASRLSVRPSHRLVDGQTVYVRGSGFTPGSEAQIVECVSPVGGCNYPPTVISVAPNGRFSVPYTLSRLLVIQTGQGEATIDCAVVGTCVAEVFNLRTGQETTAPLTFKPKSPLRVAIHVDATGQVDASSGRVTIRGTLTCTQNLSVDLTGTLTQTQPPLTLQQPLFADPQHEVLVTCQNGAASWSAPTSSWPGVYADGGAAATFSTGPVSVSLFASLPNSSAISVTSTSIDLRGHQPTKPVYYLALGESLAHGYAAPPGHGYTNDLLALLRAKLPNLELVELSCNDETTGGVITGDFCAYGTGTNGQKLTQLQAAEDFLAAHRGSVKLVTIDLGGADLLRCSTPACVTAAEPVIAHNLTTIISGLHAAGRSIPIAGDNFFDPVLSDWFEGASGQAYAEASVPAVQQFDAFLTATYFGLGIPTADIFSAYKTSNFSLVSSRWGKIPLNVDMMCRYTDIPCPQPLIDADANRAGYLIFTSAFKPVVRQLLSGKG
jgi:neocarzinostatin family protein/GDSL-like lipase/acylhydrolase family protein